MMKRFRIISLLFFIPLILLSHPKHPRKSHPKHSNTEVMLKAGFNLSNSTGSSFGANRKFKEGFTVGIQTLTRLDHHLFLQSGIFFATKGTKYEKGNNEFSLNQMYLQVPINLAYKIPLQRKTNLVLNMGPYIAYGIAGKIDKEDTFSKKNLKRFDLGIMAGVSLEVSQFALGIGYEKGLLDLSQQKANSYYNQNFLLSIGIKF